MRPCSQPMPLADMQQDEEQQDPEQHRRDEAGGRVQEVIEPRHVVDLEMRMIR